MTDSAADPLTLYCQGCNEAFLGRMKDSVCPRCGLPVDVAPPSSLQTVIWQNSDSWVETGAVVDSLHSLVGTQVDQYHVENFIGKGGMGWVFLAKHARLRRACALKVLSPSLVARDPDYLDRFNSEGQAAASLNHPNIVTVHAIGQSGDLNFLEMEFVPGRSLQKVVGERVLTPVRAATIAVGIAQGLAEAHRQGIVHRDLKPDNVLLTHQGIPKIGDFGLAKRLRGSLEREAPGSLAGTPHYMAPELFTGNEATPASDVYALGVSLFYMISGRVPFPREKWNSLIAAVTSDAPPNLRELCPGVPLELSECISQMLEKSPGNRPQDGIQAAQLLLAILGQTPDLESLMHEAFDNERLVQWSLDGHRMRVDVTLPDARRQAVFLETSQHDVCNRLLQIYSICCPAETHYHAEALRMNSQIPHGAVALREIDGQEYYVTLNNYPRATVDAEEIRRSVLELAMRADAIERLLTGEDRQ